MISTFLLALPYTFKNVEALLNTLIKVNITGNAGGCWYLQKQADKWQLVENCSEINLTASINIPQVIAWKLFSKSIRHEQIMSEVNISGDKLLARQVLNMVSVMA